MQSTHLRTNEVITAPVLRFLSTSETAGINERSPVH